MPEHITMEEHEHAESPPAKRRRASRAGAEKRFQCQHPGCDKRYSRAEHLHRHELNHNPKEIYKCEEPNCGHSFVRPDLFARHKARHDELVTQNPGTTNVESSIGISTPAPIPPSNSDSDWTGPSQSTTDAPHPRSVSAPNISNEFAVWPSDTRPPLLTPDSTLISAGTASSTGPAGIPSHPVGSPQTTRTINNWSSADGLSAQANDNFAAWLFDSPGSQNDEFNLTNVPFLDFGLEYSPKDIWNLDDFAVHTEPSVIAGSHTTPSDAADHHDQPQRSTTLVSEQRKADIDTLLGLFLKKQRLQKPLATEDQSSLLYSPDSHSFPNLSAGMLDKFIASYWAHVDKSLSIVHQPTFSVNSCHILLLLAIVMLGAADVVRSKPKGYFDDYKEFSDMVATHLRWEIFTDTDAQPPVQLWVAQALLLLEFYEKQWSTRKLHERAHIHHASTLTLLRRGSPLVGRSESESPVSGMPTRCATPALGDENDMRPRSAFDTWWIHWVRTESFNRVVFAAFQMDTLHAVMYGHAADMAPYEIRLPLPCDDSLWIAKSAEEVHRLDANLKMYGIKPINFLDGLKRCLHAHEVQTHAPARTLLMAGLLSVGWHISRREKHLQFLETIPSMREQGRWRSLLLQAFGHWRHSFDEAVGSRKTPGQGTKLTDAGGPSVLFHLAHMTMHADIIDIQIFSGTKRLLGRKVSEKDYLHVTHRMKSWACTPVARHAVLHSFKLLHEVLVSKPRKGAAIEFQLAPTIGYSCRHDNMFYRPWSVYLASLIVWAYQRASSLHISGTYNQPTMSQGHDERELCCRYLSTCASIEDPARLLPLLSSHGCAAILSVVSQDFSNGETELLIEAARRLQNCRDMLITNITSRIPG